MSEPHDRLSTAFTDLAVSLMPEVNLPGPAAARQSVRQRRRHRAAVLAAAVAAIIVVPLAAFALLRGGSSDSPDITPATPSATPSATTSASPSPSTSAAAPGLRIIRDHYDPSTPLDDALLPVPWFGDGIVGCPEGETQYTDGAWQGAMMGADPPTYVRSHITMVATGDVDRDGISDWIATLTCNDGRMHWTHNQLVAYAAAGAGQYRLIGQVFATDGNSGIGAAEVDADGTVRVVVSEGVEPPGLATSEWRTFRWDGSRFVLVGSPEPIPAPEPTNLRVTVSPSTVAGAESVLTVTVENVGLATTDYLVLHLIGLRLVRPEGYAGELSPIGCDPQGACDWAMRLEPVAPGESASGRFTVSGAASSPTISVVVLGGSYAPVSVPNLTNENVVTIMLGN